MPTIRIVTTIPDNRTLAIEVPREFPTGRASITISAEENGEPNSRQIANTVNELPVIGHSTEAINSRMQKERDAWD